MVEYIRPIFGPKLAEEANNIANKTGETGSEKISGGATKVQQDWKELIERFEPEKLT
jgi:hypothetical protein